MVADSFRPLTIRPFCHFSFLTAFGKGGAPSRCFDEACEARISHCSTLVFFSLAVIQYSSSLEKGAYPWAIGFQHNVVQVYFFYDLQILLRLQTAPIDSNH